MSELTYTILDTALTDVAAAGVKLRKVLSELEGSCDTAHSRTAWVLNDIAATSRFISAFSIFHSLAQGDEIPTLGPDDAPIISDNTGVAETVIRAKRAATMSDLEKTLAESYELDEATARAKASDLSLRLSKCLDKTRNVVKTKLKLQEPIQSTANQARLSWASSFKHVTKDDQSWIKNFATEGSLAFPTELFDTDSILAQSGAMRLRLEMMKTAFGL